MNAKGLSTRYDFVAYDSYSGICIGGPIQCVVSYRDQCAHLRTYEVCLCAHWSLYETTHWIGPPMVFLGFTGTFFSNSEWGSTQNVLMIVLHWSKQISRNCTHLLPNTRSTHTVKIFFSLMTVYRFGVDPQSIYDVTWNPRICDRVNTHKKRQISNFAISGWVKIWHQRSFPYARVRILCDKSHRVDRIGLNKTVSVIANSSSTMRYSQGITCLFWAMFKSVFIKCRSVQILYHIGLPERFDYLKTRFKEILAIYFLFGLSVVTTEVTVISVVNMLSFWNIDLKTNICQRHCHLGYSKPIMLQAKFVSSRSNQQINIKIVQC